MNITTTPVRIHVIQQSPFWDEEITVVSGYQDEDGEFIVEHCNHAGAIEVELTAYEYTAFEHEEMVKVCDKCNKQYVDGDWV